MHTSMATPELAANHHTGNEWDHLYIVEHSNADAQVIIHFHA